MKQPILTPAQVESMRTLLTGASCSLDNLFAGTAEDTGILDAEECFTKRDLTTLNKAADTIDRLLNDFDGTQKQRR